MPSKELTELADDKNKKDLKVVTKAQKNRPHRKETKKSKAHVVKETRHYAKRLVMGVYIPYEVCIVLKEKYAVSKSRQEFSKLHKEQNESKST